MSDNDLEGRVALITGAARGIGAASARALARRGAEVHVTDVLDAAPVAEEIAAAGGHAQAHVLDVRAKSAFDALLASLAARDRAVDIAVCNAGICPPGEPVGSDEQWARVIDINLNGVRNTIAAVWDGMRERGGGTLVVISSMAFYRGGVIVGTEYSASKAALIGLTRHLARNGGPLGIRCNAVAPGIIDTEMTRDFAKPDADEIPLRRLGTAEDVAGPISFLCGPESAYMTGAVLNVTGGLVLAD